MAIQDLERASGGTAHIELHQLTGAPRVIRLVPGSLALAGDDAPSRSRSFLERYGKSLGLNDAVRDLVLNGTLPDRLGGEHLRFHQQHRGASVFGAELRLHFNPEGELVTVNGRVVPDIGLASVAPTMTGNEAAATATALVSKQSGASDLVAEARGPLVFRSGLVAGRPGSDHLVWEVEVGNGADVREFLYVDAHQGFVVDQITGIENLHRTIYHRNLGARVWDEGDRCRSPASATSRTPRSTTSSTSPRTPTSSSRT